MQQLESVILEARGITKNFPGVKALDDVSVSIQKGTVHAIVGENGAGKSTLMLVFGGVYAPDSGEMIFEGKSVKFSSTHEANSSGIGVVYQELSLIMNLSVAENIFANRQPLKWGNLVDWELLYKKTSALLAGFGADSIDPHALVGDLSIAKRQVVEILKAMSLNPKVLILDEPTSSLTEVEVHELLDNIRKLKANGITVIYISHHISEIFEIADTVTILRDGKRVCDARVCDIDEDFLVTNMVGRTIGNIYGSASADRVVGENVFEVRGLAKKNTFKDISFQVKSGEIVGFAGLVGSGRTEVGRAIFGAEPADHGETLLFGKDIKLRSTKQAILNGIGYLTEDRKTHGLFVDFSIMDNLVANHLGDFTSFTGFLMRNEMAEFAKSKIADFKVVTRSANQLVGKLSGGNQQKVLLGSWFGIKPKFLIVDEPTRGVDVGSKSDIYRLLRSLAETGVAIMLISSDLAEIVGISDRVYVMREGTICGELSHDRINEENVIMLATGLHVQQSKECTE
jgi:ABC-type sugar transport system ATPase subunit